MPRPIGRPRRPEPRIQLHIYVTPRIALELKDTAAAERRPVSTLCRIFVEDALAARRAAQSSTL